MQTKRTDQNKYMLINHKICIILYKNYITSGYIYIYNYKLTLNMDLTTKMSYTLRIFYLQDIKHFILRKQ